MANSTAEPTDRPIDWEGLFAAARAARDRAHAPYSGFRVGAAILTDGGAVVGGCNVENAAFPLGSCAEQGAISAMVAGSAGGAPRIRAILIVGSGADPCWPCGGCRQRIREFATGETRLAIADRDAIRVRDLALEALLPHAFGPDNLPGGRNPVDPA